MEQGKHYLMLFAVPADRLGAALHVRHLCQLAYQLAFVLLLQMIGQNPNPRIGFRYEPVPNQGNTRRSHVRWHLAMNWGDTPTAGGPQVSDYPVSLSVCDDNPTQDFTCKLHCSVPTRQIMLALWLYYVLEVQHTRCPYPKFPPTPGPEARGFIYLA